MRIRQIKPGFWSDSVMARLPEATRLFYIGTWCLADDAGWLEANIPEIAHQLYGYDARPKREGRVTRMLGELAAVDRIVDHGCGHLELPTLVGHQHLAGATKRVTSTFNDHLRACVSGPRATPPIPADPREVPPTAAGEEVPADPRKSPRSPANPRPVKGNGKERERVRSVNGDGQSIARARPRRGAARDDEPSEFEAKLAAAGFPRP